MAAMPGGRRGRAWRAKEVNVDGQTKRHGTAAATRAEAPGSVFAILTLWKPWWRRDRDSRLKLWATGGGLIALTAIYAIRDCNFAIDFVLALQCNYLY